LMIRIYRLWPESCWSSDETDGKHNCRGKNAMTKNWFSMRWRFLRGILNKIASIVLKSILDLIWGVIVHQDIAYVLQKKLCIIFFIHVEICDGLLALTPEFSC
jgi:hypothetical protein